MTTPVLFLDNASRHMGSVGRPQAERTAITLLETLKHLRKINKKFALNTALPIAQYQIADDWTLQSVLGGIAFKEEWEFIRALNDRSPFASGLENDILQEVGGMEFRTSDGQVPSYALSWAMLLESATVSFDGHPDWSQAWVKTDYSALEDDGSLREEHGRVRNASKVLHVDEHAAWLKSFGFSDVPSPLQLWSERTERFPGLRFLRRVEKDLAALSCSGAPFLQALSALEILAKDVAEWQPENPWPNFSAKASPEAEQRQKFCWADDDETGTAELFDWHTRFTGGLAGRIHFRVDAEKRLIVVAYVGGKLMREISG